MKQKKIFLFMLSLMMVVLTLGSCGKKECQHDWKDTTIITPATCTSAGLKEQKCTKCNENKTIEINALGHDMQNVNAKEPTCTETGYDAYQQCSRCEYNTKGSDISALNHSFSENWTSNEISHWHECTHDNCDVKTDETMHSDTNNDHLCDVCKTKLSECKDENNDHLCDLCNTKVSECKDENNDHLCDKCNTKVSECKDENNDHLCDKCNTKLSECKDENNDHLCDVCKIKLSECKDENNDHICDKCNTKVSECSGGTATCQAKAICSICGLTYGEFDYTNHVDEGKEEWGIENGKHWKQWSCCQTKITDKVEHQFDQKVIDSKYHSSDATCTEGEKYYYSCICGEKGNITFEYGDALGHTYGVWNKGKEESCTENGIIAHKDCTICLKHFDENGNGIENIEIAACHKFNTDSWIIDTAHHYHGCSCEGCTEKIDSETHNFVNGICDTCKVHNTFGTTGLIYKYIDKTQSYRITGYKGEELDVVIPYFYNDGENGENKVTEIYEKAFYNNGSYYVNNNEITSVIISDSIEIIGKYAFSGCKAITSIVIPNSVIQIDEFAFSECTNLENIKVSNNLRTTGRQIFYNTAWYNSQENGVLYIDNYLYYLKGIKSPEQDLAIKEGTIGIFSYAFYDADELNTVIFPSSLKWIGRCAFEYASLVSINIPSTVEDVYDYAFCNMVKLKSINISSGVGKIGNCAFGSASNVETITIESGNTLFGVNVFKWAGQNLKDKNLIINLPSDMECIYNGMFLKAGITTFTIPSSITKIENNAFKYTSLSEITIPSTVKYVGNSAFSYIYNLETITIESGNTQFGTYVFLESGKKLDSNKTLNVNFPSDITSISEGMFSASAIGNIEIPSSVKTIGAEAFYGCNRITEIMIPATVELIKDKAFGKCENLIKITFPYTLDVLRTKTDDIENCHWFKLPSKNLIIYYEGGTFQLYHEKVEETCTEDGIIEYYEEILNNKFYTDGVFSTVITDIIIPASHTGGTATCEEQAICSRCNQKYGETLGHEYSATWSENAEYHWKECKRTECESHNDEGLHDYENGICKICNGKDVYGTEGFSFNYDWRYQHYAITGYEGTEKNIIIPSYYKGYIVGIIDKEAFKGNTLIESVTIKYGLKNIDKYAFSECTNLITIEMPNTVTSIGNYAFAGCTSLKNINISNQLTSLGEYVFQNCGNLEDITLPDTISTLEIGAFYGCNLKNIILPDNITEIKANAFMNCASLETVKMSSNIEVIGSEAFNNCNLLKAVYISDLKTWAQANFGSKKANPLYYAKHLYLNESLVKNLIIPDGTKSVSSNSFVNCIDLISVTIPNSVTSIGYYPFYGCGYIETITTPIAGAKKSGSLYPFGLYFGLTEFENSVVVEEISRNSWANSEFYIPKSLKTIHITGEEITDYAFANMTQIETITFDYVKTIGKSAFTKLYNLTSVSLPSTLESIGNDAFNKCYRLAEVKNNSTLEIQTNSTSNGCVGLYAIEILSGDEENNLAIDSNGFMIYETETESILVKYVGSERIITIPDGITKINQYAFYLSNIISVDLPDSLQEIGNYAFNNCKSLAKVSINGESSNLTTIGTSAFNECYSLFAITLPINLTSIGNNAFYYCKKLIEIVNYSSLEITAQSSSNGSVGYYAINIVKESKDSKITIDENNFVIYTDGEEKILVAYLGENTEIVLPDNLTSIYDYAFRYNDFITKIEIPDSVKKIGNYAFAENSALVSIVLPKNLETIGEGTFKNATNLVSITLPSSLTTISKQAFSNCTSLSEIIFNEGISLIESNAFAYCTSLKTITIPGYIKEIGSYAFLHSGLETVILEEGVETLNIGAFSFCTSLTTFYIPVSVTLIDGSAVFGGDTKLTEINYAGTYEQWCTLNLTDGFPGTPSDFVIKCTDYTLNKNNEIVE